MLPDEAARARGEGLRVAAVVVLDQGSRHWQKLREAARRSSPAVACCPLGPRSTSSKVSCVGSRGSSITPAPGRPRALGSPAGAGAFLDRNAEEFCTLEADVPEGLEVSALTFSVPTCSLSVWRGGGVAATTMRGASS